MSLELLAVSFNHDGGASQALNIRRGVAEPVLVPEWRRGSAGDACVCYSLDRLIRGPITVRVHIARRPPEADSTEVRAIALPLPQSSEWWASSLAPALDWPAGASQAYWFALYATMAMGTTSPGTVQPCAISPQHVTFPPGGETQATLTVVDTGLGARGVGVHPVAWRWQFRRSATSDWIDFGFTRHRVYVVLSTPTLPWVQAPNDPRNTQLPWCDVLEVACRWAAGATTVETAAARVTQAVYGLGLAGRIAYDCAGSSAASIGTPHYTLLPGFFDCSEFAARIRGGLGNGGFVNCSDCAAAVSTFANVLGCDLSQSRMFGPVPFPLNPTRGIGSTNWLSACSIGVYSMHEVAWTGACGQGDSVYDACLEVDGDGDPTRPPHTPLLPVNLRFGAPGQLLYRDRLAAPSGRAVCRPQPLTRQRRFVR